MYEDSGNCWRMKTSTLCVIYVTLCCSFLGTTLGGVVSEGPPNDLMCSDQEDYKCKGAPSFSWSARGCECDPLCAEYGDCCYDSEYYDSRQRASAAEEYRCVRTNYDNGIYMKNSCPAGWQDEAIRRQCVAASPEAIALQEDPLSHVPVWSNSTHVTYANYFCALCNNDTEDINFWKVDVQCPLATNNHSGADLSFQEGMWGVVEDQGGEEVFHKCKISLDVMNLIIYQGRTCKVTVDNCTANWGDEHVRDLCESYTSIINIYDVFYKNSFCATCNNVSRINAMCVTSSVIHAYLPVDDPDLAIRFGNARPRSFSLLIDFSCRGGSDRVGESCEVYDPFSKSSRSLRLSGEDSTRGNLVLPPSPDDGTLPSTGEGLCANRTLRQGEFHWVDETVVEVLTNDSFGPGEYEQVEGGVRVCSNYTFTQRFSPAMGWVTLGGLGLSSLCLVLHLAAFSVVPHLRNLHGKNLASLSVALLFAYVSFVLSFFADSWASECYVVAVLIYYFFVASFSWMNVLGFDVFSAFRRAQTELRVSSGEQWRRFCLYSAYGWLLPLLCVAMVLGVDLTAPAGVPEELLPGLGRHVCWFGRRQALLVFFGVPLFGAIVLNAVLFVATSAIIATTRQSEVRKSSTSSQNKKQFLMYLRLAVLMGLTWITAALASYFQQEAVYYLFVVLNSLQGVLIFLAFTCRRKVWKNVALTARRLRQRCCGRTEDAVQSQSETVSSSPLSATPFSSEISLHSSKTVSTLNMCSLSSLKELSRP